MRARLAPLLVLLVTARARAAPDEPPVGWSIAAGAATALIPLAVGGGLIASSDDRGTRIAGLMIIEGGLALAPILSHAVSREWRRAALFGALPVASAAAMAVFTALTPDVLVDLGDSSRRIPFAAMLIASVLGSAGGLVDSFLAGERARAITIAPLATPRGAGLSIGGWL